MILSLSNSGIKISQPLTSNLYRLAQDWPRWKYLVGTDWCSQLMGRLIMMMMMMMMLIEDSLW